MSGCSPRGSGTATTPSPRRTSSNSPPKSSSADEARTTIEQRSQPTACRGRLSPDKGGSMKTLALVLALTAGSGQLAGPSVAGAWTAEFDGHTFLRLELQSVNGAITG